MTLFVTYVSEDGDQLVVALSIELKKSQVMTDVPRFINTQTGEIYSKQVYEEKQATDPSLAPTTA